MFPNVSREHSRGWVHFLSSIVPGLQVVRGETTGGGVRGDMSGGELRIAGGQPGPGAEWGQPDFPPGSPWAPMSLANNNLADLLSSSWQLLLVTNSGPQASVSPRRSSQSDIINNTYSLKLQSHQIITLSNLRNLMRVLMIRRNLLIKKIFFRKIQIYPLELSANVESLIFTSWKATFPRYVLINWNLIHNSRKSE